MYNYNITGRTGSGMRITEMLQALDDRHALSIINSKYGFLRDLDISTVSSIDELQEPLEEIEQTKKYFSSSAYNDDEIVAMIALMNANHGSQEHYEAVRAHFSPIINAAVGGFPQLSSSEKQEYKSDLLVDIIQSFGPKFLAERGYLLSFIKMKIQDRIKRKYVRQKYVNPNNRGKRRLRSDVMADYAEANIYREEIDEDDAKRILIQTIQSAGNKDLSRLLPRPEIEEIHERIVHFGLEELLSSKKQKEIYILSYGPKRLRQSEIATLLNISQPNVCITLGRAKKNVWSRILKLNTSD